MNLRTLSATAAVLFCSLYGSTPANAGEVGVMNFTFDAPHRERLVQSLLFYPAAGGGVIEQVGNNAVFRGELLRRDARPEALRHPLVILSHGSGGNAAGVAWLANRLAQEGFVVAIPNHQGSMSADSTPETTIPALWLRPADLSRMLNAIEQSETVGKIVDLDDVTALGFSLGGAAVLTMAGAEFRADQLAAFCDAEPDTIGCPWLRQGNALIPGHVDLHKIDAVQFNSAHEDTRIKRVIAVDPGFVPALDMHSVANINVPLHVINLGDFDDMPKGLRADHISQAASNGTYTRVDGATHFDFLPECRILGWFYVWMEGDDPVCSASGDRSRAEIHDDIATKVLNALKSHDAEKRLTLHIPT